MENNFEKTERIVGINTKLNQFSKLANSMNPISESVKKNIEMQDNLKLAIPTLDIPKIQSYVLPKIEIPNFEKLFNNELLKGLKQIGNIGERLKNNPELQFGFISDLAILNLKSAEELKKSLTTDLTDMDIKEKEEILYINLITYLKNHNIESLWVGATQVLESDNNPDKLRQCLISLRTILEYLIDQKLAPIEKLAVSLRELSLNKEYKQT